ncbi:MAG: hypothetical protein E7005_06735 [Alphaproteobacteria bacterium]|nr:hypothetical protein [Alphaproteobacteria bacterium]
MKVKKTHINPILYCIIATLLSALIGFFLILFGYTLNTTKSKPNIRQSSLILLQEQDIYPKINRILPGSKRDNFSTSLMLNISNFSVSTNALLNTANNPRTEYNMSNHHANLFMSSFDDNIKSANIINYPRYWHGYIPILRPLLNLFNLNEIRIINQIIGIILLLITLIIIYKKFGTKIALSFMLTIFFLNPLTMLKCPSFSSIYYISLLTILAILKTTIKPYKIFLFAGILTSFFDLLTAPIVPLGLALIFFCLNNKTNLKNDFKQIIKLSLSFLFGFSFMILQKWIITSIITENNILKDIYGSLIWRINGDTYIETGITDKGYIATLKRNFNELKSQSTLIVLAIYFFLISLFSLLKKDFIINKDYRIILLLIIASIPFIWYSIFQNHSFVHPIMSYRELTIFIFAITTIISLGLKSPKA